MPSHNKREFFPFVTAIFGEKEGNGGRKPIVKALVLLLLRDMIRQICTKACNYTTQGRRVSFSFSLYRHAMEPW